MNRHARGIFTSLPYVFMNWENSMKIVIVGCGKVGTSIARELITSKHEITVVDINRNAVARLSESLDVLGVEGNGATY